MLEANCKSKGSRPTGKELHLEVLPLKQAALVLRASNHDLRQRLLRFVHQRGRVRVGDLYRKLRLEQSVASQHLSILRKAGFVRTEREGRFLYYSVNYERLSLVQQLAGALQDKAHKQ